MTQAPYFRKQLQKWQMRFSSRGMQVIYKVLPSLSVETDSQ